MGMVAAMGDRVPTATPRRTSSRAWRWLFVPFLLAACQSTEGRQERLVSFVDELMFGSPFDAHALQDKTVLRWEEPICVGIEGADGGEWDDRVASVVGRMAEAAGRKLETSETGDCTANVVLRLTRDDRFLVNREHANCYMRIKAAEHRIARAWIFIGLNRPALFDRCLAHELMHVLGFRYHSGIVRSVLSPTHHAEQLTDWDLLAIRALYDPRLRPALPRRDALPFIRATIAEWEDGR